MNYLERKHQATYTHVQTVASKEWTIVHNLLRLPIVNVYVNVDGVEQIILPKDVTVVDDTTCVVSFSVEFIGSAEVF